jgi:hypothetical protein
MKETNIDSMKYRKFTHIAGVDVELVVAEKGKCEYTIKECYYQKNVDVSGNKTDGYFIEWLENGVMPMVVNSGNRKIITQIALQTKQLPSVQEARNIGNWAGLKIELRFNPNVKMMGKIVGGIEVVMPEFKPVARISDANAMAKFAKCTNNEELADVWKSLTAEEKNLPTVVAKKEELKTKFSNPAA